MLWVSLCSVDVSFIVPALNEEKCIEKTLKSIKAQKTKLKCELIVIDGMSEDRTVAIAKKYAKVYSQKARGIADARNMGAKKARGKLLVFIDADSRIPPEYTEKVWERLSSRKDIVALTAQIRYDLTHLVGKIIWKFVEFFFYGGSNLLGRGYLVGINTAVWRDAFDAVSGFPDIISEDTAFAEVLWKFGKTEYFKGTYCISSARRFNDHPWEFVRYYFKLNVAFKLSKSRSEKLREIASRAKYKPVR